MTRFDKSIAALMDSYSDYGLVNQAGGANLPSRKSIETILHEIDQLIFPGFREQEGLDHDNLRLLTAERVNRLARELEQEVEKSIVFSWRTSGRRAYSGSELSCGNEGCHARELEQEVEKSIVFSRRTSGRRAYSGSELSCGNEGCHAMAELITGDFFDELPHIRSLLALDMEAAFRGDPAAKSAEEVIVAYPGFYAIMVHRVAHFFWEHQVPLIPRMMSEVVHGRTGIDIHPGASIGESFFIDHGTGVVIGETTIIGKNVKLYQGVTLGALSVRKEEADKKRHPTIEDEVTIYAGATILGGGSVIGRGSIIGGNVWLTSSVPPNTRVYNKTSEQEMHHLG